MQIGPYRVTVVRDGHYRLDGGAMFGVVPRVLWEKIHPPDEANRIELALNCLLLRSPDRTILIDTGMGGGWSAREIEIYGLERPQGDLIADLRRQGVEPGQVTDVVLTHLHFDHAGGAVRRDDDGRVEAAFPAATYWLQQQHLRWGRAPTERDRRSFRPEDFEPLMAEDGRVRLLEGPGEFLPGLRAHVVSGHTPGQQVIEIGDAHSPHLLYAADLIPFASQVHVPWIMAFDLNPVLTLREKKDLLARAVLDDWVVVFEHDPRVAAARIEHAEGRYRVREEVEL